MHMGEKKFETIERQIEILKNRGLIIEDENDAKEFFMKNNYYRISGYTLSLRKNDRFFPNITLSNVKDIYYFDSALRHKILALISEMETTVKSIYAYRFAERYEPYAYLDDSIFTNKEIYTEIIKKVEVQKENVKSFELCVKHFINKNERFPVWAYIELFTFGNISHLYTISELELKKIVATDLGFSMNKGWSHVGSSLRVITTLRNLCAHGSRLYNRRFSSKPSLSKQDEKYLRVYIDGTLDNDHLFSYLLTVKRFVSKDSFQKFLCEVQDLYKVYPSIDLSKYGFPTYWETVFAN